MKKKNSWLYLVIAFFAINFIINILPNQDSGENRVFTIFPFLMFVFFLVVGKALVKPQNDHSDKEDSPPPPLSKPKAKERPKNQELYDEDSFKIDPDDYKL